MILFSLRQVFFKIAKVLNPNFESSGTPDSQASMSECVSGASVIWVQKKYNPAYRCYDHWPKCKLAEPENVDILGGIASQ